MKLYTLYVGQGACSVVLRHGEAIIIDCRIPARGDDSAEFLKAQLAHLVSGHEVIGLILTGFDADHADPRGVSWILKKYQPRWLMYPKYRKLTGTAGSVFRAIKQVEGARSKSKAPLRRISVRLDQIENRKLRDLSEHLLFTVFSPHPADMVSSNCSSLVVKVEPKPIFHLGFRYLITGDTENDRWEQMNKIFGAELRAEVLAAPHHGSRNGVNAKTLKLVRPRFVLVSAGVDNQFNHPHDEALALYKKYGARVCSTHTGKSFCTQVDYVSHWGLITQEWSLAEATAT